MRSRAIGTRAPGDSAGSGRSWWTLPLKVAPAAALVAGLLAAVVYVNSVGNGFALDDVPIIVENTGIHELSDLPEALATPYWGPGSGETSGIWRPLTTTALAVQWALWEDDAAPYHVLNVVLHAGVTVLVTLLMAELIPVAAAFAGGLVFAVHPVHVEAVSNIVGLAELLAALFLTGACLLFVRSGHGASRKGEGSGDGETGTRPGSKAFRLSPLTPATVGVILLLYALGFLSKESAAVLPALFVLLDAWKGRLGIRDLPRYLKSRGLLFALMAVVGGAILWVRIRVLGGVATALPPLGGELLEEVPRIWTLPVVWLHYLRLLVFPADLSPDYTPGVIEIQLGWNALNLTGVIVALAVLGFTWAAWRDAETPGAVPVGILWFLIAILPVANVVFLAEILLAERTLYTPSIGFAMAVGALVWHLAERSRRPRLVATGVLVAVALMVGRTWTMTPVWNSTMSVMQHLLAQHPESGRVQWMWADFLMDGRDEPTAGLGAYREALATTHGTYAISDDLVEDLLRLGFHRQAATIAELMWNDRPDDARAPARLAVALSNLGRHSELIDPARAALSANPGSGLLHHLLALGYRERGDLEAAIRHRRAAIENGEGIRWQQWVWLAELQREVGDTAEALRSLGGARERARDSSARRLLDSLWREWESP